jgi:hypothetical protein
MKLLGLPRQHLRSVRSLEPFKSLIFLFNISTRFLHGIFEPTGPGGENLNPHAWSRNKGFSRSSPFPAQIPFGVVKEYKPIPESSFRHLFPDGNRIRRLNAKQVREIVQLFVAQGELYEKDGKTIDLDRREAMSDHSQQQIASVPKPVVSGVDVKAKRIDQFEGVFDSAWNKEPEPISFMDDTPITVGADEIEMNTVPMVMSGSMSPSTLPLPPSLSLRPSSPAVQNSTVSPLWKNDTPLSSWNPPQFSRISEASSAHIWANSENSAWSEQQPQPGLASVGAGLTAKAAPEALSLFGAWDQVLKTSSGPVAGWNEPRIRAESEFATGSSSGVTPPDIWSSQRIASVSPSSTWSSSAQSSWDAPPQDPYGAPSKWKSPIWGMPNGSSNRTPPGIGPDDTKVNW